MKRRQALKSLGLSLGTITITPSILGLLQSCQNNPDWNPVFFEKKHIYGNGAATSSTTLFSSCSSLLEVAS